MNVWSIYAVGFVLGLTGAMAPGPLLTVTITESARRGGHVGPMVILGHGILEFALLLLIVFGVASLLAHPLTYTVVSFAGGLIIIYMGIGILRCLGTYSLGAAGDAPQKGLHPVIAGIVVSLSNPYWFIWWVTIGMGYVMFAGALGIAGIIAFFAGHISADLAWYSLVSYGIAVGGKYMSTRVIKTVLFLCSLFLILFGMFFVTKGYQFLTQA